MASEAVLLVETELPINFTCADATGIEKGAILKLTDPMTVVLADGDDDFVGGIAAEEKIADNGVTEIGVYRGGIFRVLAGAAITIGDAVSTFASTGATNEVHEAPATAVSSKTLGISLEAAADTNTFVIELRPGVNPTAFA